MSRRLLVITEELPRELCAAGADAAVKTAYYNPAGCFDGFTLMDWGRGGDWPGIPVMALPPEPALEAWLATVQAADFAAPMGDEIAAGWPGVPPSWLAQAREFGPCCVRAYGARWSGWLGLELAAALGVPVVISLHNVIGLCSAVLRRARRLIAVSDEVARAAIGQGADPACVVTVHNRVDRALFSPDGPTAAGPKGSPCLLCVARDVPQKNLDRLVEACQSARAVHPQLRLVHIGRSARDWSRLGFALHLDAVPNVELPPWYRWADALVLPSLFEGFGTAIVEALACGTPVLTSNRAPMNEVVTDQWDGLLFDPLSVPDIARAIGAIADPALRARLAAPARAASEAYDVATIGRREAGVYALATGAPLPKVSVVMPTYNRADWVEAAVRNTLGQDYPDLELIVVNDGSTDDTARRLKPFESDHRVRVIHQPNAGLSGAINAGMAVADGELVMWKADDDLFAPGAIAALARELVLDPEAGVVFADYELADASGARRVVQTGPLHELASRNVIGLCFLIRRSVWQQAGGVNPQYHLAEDYELWLRLSRLTRLRRLARVLYTVTEHAGTLTQSRLAQVLEMTMRVQQTHVGRPDSAARADQLVRLAGAYKNQGMVLASLGAAWRLAPLRPWAACRAGVRALVPGPLLKLWRGARARKD